MKSRLKEIFPDFKEEELIEEIAKHGIVKSFSKGEEFLRPGKFINSIPLVLEGIIKISKKDDFDNEVILYYLKKGETCAHNLHCCMVNEVSQINAEAETDVTLLFIPLEFLDKWSTEYLSWKRFVLKTFKNKFDQLLQVIDEIAFNNIDFRLINYLNEKQKIAKDNIIKTTHQDIAIDLNSSREVISRLLKKIENQGKIKLGRGKIELINLM
jgi:CRP/FNR family transcriptional regulator